ncbi:MAG: hypothetical protein RL041_411, partial [Bacteroidota bacterium]
VDLRIGLNFGQIKKLSKFIEVLLWTCVESTVFWENLI